MLGLLADQDLHGYELKKRLTRLLGPWSSVSFGSLYPALNRLERAGAIVSHGDPPSTPAVSASLGAELAAFRSRSRPATASRRGRKVYALTAQGRERLAGLLQDATGDDRSFAIRVAFCSHLDSEQRLTLFARRDSELARRQAERPTASDLTDRFRRSVDDFHHDRLARERAWLSDLVAAEALAHDALSHEAAATTTRSTPHLPGGSPS